MLDIRKYCAECSNVVTENLGTDENPLCSSCYHRMTDEYSDNKEDGTPKFEEKIKLLDLFLSFKGRIGIGPFWIGSGAVIITLSFLFFLELDGEQNTSRTCFVALLSISVIWSSLALHVKRFHDRCKSGIWILFNLVPIIGSLWVFIECGLLPGSNGINRYGKIRKKIKLL